MKNLRKIVIAVLLFSLCAAAQTTFQPKFPGDPAKSDSEEVALGWLRTVTRAQKRYYKNMQGKYAPSLRALVGHGSFTKRMANPDRGDYTAEFHSKKDGYSVTLVPKQFDPTRRSFYVDEDGKIRVEEGKPATASSPVLKAAS
jgi:hypothetical protein